MSLTVRAILAIFLMVGFYVGSFCLALLLLWIPYAELAIWHKLEIRITLACLVAGLVILWSLIPRRDKFNPPGPLVTREQQPRLFAELDNIAAKTGQTLPHEVYLIPQVNAFVAQRGGTMGIGSRRVMGIGVPLMRLLTVSQFRAVLAHEFGHYCGGDTALGPWIYKTRIAIVRTIQQLVKARSYAAYLFVWYGKFYMRVTLAVSRSQEFAADRLGATVAGARAMAEGLKQLHTGNSVWSSYLQNEVQPVVSAGFSPPLSEGLHMFLESPRIKQAAAKSLQSQMVNGKAEPYDSHPALPQRLAALATLPAGDEEDPRPAIDLLDNYAAADSSLFLSPPGVTLKPIAWERTFESVYVASWKRVVTERAESIRGLTVQKLGEDLYSWELRNRLKAPRGVYPDNSVKDRWALHLAGSALALALLRDGWQPKDTIGAATTFSKDGRVISPFELLILLNRGELKKEAWAQRCAELGIADLSVDPQSTVAAQAGS